MLTRFLVHIVALLFVFYVVWGVRGSILWAAVLMAVILFARDGLMGVFRNRFDSAVRARRQAAGVTAGERDK